MGERIKGRQVSARRALLLASTALLTPAVALATDFTVTDAGDTGAPGQYRTQVNAANANPGADRIIFNVSPAITSNLTISDSLTIGTGAAATVSGAGVHLLNGAGSLTAGIGSNTTLNSAGAFGTNTQAGIAVTGGAWNLSIDGTVAMPTLPFNVRSHAIVVTSAGSTVTVNPTGVIDFTSGIFPVGIISYGLGSPTGLGGPSTNVNMFGGTLRAANGGANGIVLLNGGTVTMTGGLIDIGFSTGASCPAATCAGVALNNGSLVMTGGTIHSGGLSNAIGVATAGNSSIFIGAGATVIGGTTINTRGFGYSYGGLTLHTQSQPTDSAQIRVAGTVTSDFLGAPATAMALGADVLTLERTFVITGLVDANLPATLQLGGTGNGTFNVSNIGPAQQYRGFATFNKIEDSTWTLTGSGAQNWTISGGTLIGDTNSLQGPAITDNAALVFNQAFAGTYAGAISGTGSVSKNGTGTVTFSGANTYTGATNINAGTLRMGIANALSSATAVTVASGATFDLNSFNQTIGSLAGAGNVTLGSAALTAGGNNGDTTFSGVMSGTGSFTKAGTGAMNLTATNTYTGPTTVNAGTLFVNGSIASSNGLTVNAGATVGGTGALPKTTINGGTLSPGNSIGTVSISGSLTFVGAGNYLVEVSPTASDRTNVSGAPGTAALSGTLLAVGTGGAYTTGTRYTVLNATGGVSGTFGTLAISGSFGATRPHVEYDANNVYLVLDPNALPLAGLTPNARAVAVAVNTAALGTAPVVFNTLFNLTAAQLPGALNALSGEVHASTVGALADESLYVRSAILGRLRQASYGNTSMASLSAGGPQAFQGADEISALAYAKSPIVTKAPLKAPVADSDIVYWAQGFGAWGRFDTDGNAATLRRDLAGVVTGFDARFGNARAGIAAGYTGSRNNLDARGSANVETGHIAAYGGFNVGAFNLRAGGAYAFHTIDTDRIIAFPGFADRATAHYDGNTGQIFGEIGYGFAFGQVAVEPFAGAAFVRVNTDAATERALAAGLNIAGTSFEVGYASLGIRAASMIPVGDGMVLIPRASAAWQHAFNSVTPAETLAFLAGGPAFTISSVPIARDSLLAEAGLDLAINRNATIGVSYVGQIANNVQDHAAKGRFSWKF